ARAELSRHQAGRCARAGPASVAVAFRAGMASPAPSLPPAAPPSWRASGMGSQAASGGTPTRSPAVAVVVGEEELLVERAVARLVAAASAATGQAGAGEGPFPDRSGVHEVSGGALGHGDLATLTAPSLFGGGCVVVVRDAHNAGKDVAEELTRLAAEPPPDVGLVVT